MLNSILTHKLISFLMVVACLALLEHNWAAGTLAGAWVCSELARGL